MFSPTRLAAALDAWITRTPAEAPCHCARCADRAAALVPATAEQAAQSGFPQIGEGDLLCPACAEVLADDGETILRESAAMAARYLETVARHPATVTLALRLPRIVAAMAAGMLLAACDHAELNARADANTEAWIAGLEADDDPSPPPWSSQWDPTVDALCGRRAA